MDVRNSLLPILKGTHIGICSLGSAVRARLLVDNMRSNQLRLALPVPIVRGLNYVRGELP